MKIQHLTTLAAGCALLAVLVGPAEGSITLPDQVADLQLWLKADAGVFEDDAGTNPAESGDAVARWNDQSPGNHDAEGLDTPAFQTNVVNALPVVRFDGGADRMFLRDAVTHDLTPISTDPDQLTIFAVVSQDSGDVSQDHVFTHRNSGVQLIQASLQGDEARLQLRGSGNHLVDFTAPGVTNGGFNVIMWQFDVVNDLHAIAVNGPSEVTNTYDFGSETFIVGDSQRIGYWFNGGVSSGFLNGDLAELVVYEGRALSPAEKNAVGFYLAHKYGLDTQFDIPEPGTFAVWAGLAGLGLAAGWLRRRRAA